MITCGYGENGTLDDIRSRAQEMADRGNCQLMNRVQDWGNISSDLETNGDGE